MRVLTSLGLLLVAVIAQAADPSQATLQRRIPEIMDLAEVPGLSVAVIRAGQIAWSRGFGVKNTATKEPVDPEAIEVFKGNAAAHPTSTAAQQRLADTLKKLPAE